jgi:probable addiction module antidote protein
MKITKWNTLDYLLNDKMLVEYLEAVIDEDVSYLPTAIGTVIKAKGINEIEKQSGIKRETLYKAFSENGNPTLKTLSQILSAFNIRLSVASILPETKQQPSNEPFNDDCVEKGQMVA